MRAVKASGKTAVVLFNLGGPDSPSSVRPFLFNLFNDPAIITLPNPLRYMLAKLISSGRDKKAQAIYAHLGGGSPILPLTEKQASALQKKLGAGFEVFIGMRYWHPFVKEAAEAVKAYQPDRVVLLPLYPQFSTTTTGSSFDAWDKAAAELALAVPTTRLCCYYADKAFVHAHAETIRTVYQKARRYGNPRILFSAHGLPKKVIEAGDPYQWQVEQTVQSVVDALSIKGLDHRVTYQSKVGRLEWIGPATDTEIIRAAEEKRPIVVVPIAFVSEHSETLVELDIEYRELAEANGAAHYFRVPALGADKAFIGALAHLVQSVKDCRATCANACGGKPCPAAASACAMRAR
ncbi:MAG: ferrochelatase [Proteobacteria bacterium]|nr:ferrochelatase [Pseudomonadota bacterium]